MAILPQSRPKMTRAEVLDLVGKHFGAYKNESVDKAVLVGIRGYYLDSIGKKGENDLNHYDDAIFLISPDKFISFNANADPAKAGKRLAMLVPAKYEYYKGKHKQRYDALRPFPEGVQLKCTRDGVISYCSHTNIHKGGAANTHSEGCQTLPPSQWDEFQKLVYAQMTKYKQKTIEYFLLENTSKGYLPKPIVPRVTAVASSGEIIDVALTSASANENTPEPVLPNTQKNLETDNVSPHASTSTRESLEEASEQTPFNPIPDPGTVVTQYIPKMKGAAGFFRIFTGGGLLSTIYAALSGQPPWVVFTIGFLTALAVIAFSFVVVKYRNRLFDLVKTVIRINADPFLGNIQLTPTKENGESPLGLNR